MRQAPFKKLKLLGELNLPSAVAVPDALALIEELIPSIGSMLLWSNPAGEVAGGYSTLAGMEVGPLFDAIQLYGSTLEGDLQRKYKAECCRDFLQVPLEELYQSEVYREVMAPYGIEDFARVVVTVNGQPMGWMVVFRGAGAQPFSQHELRNLDQVAPLLGAIIEDSEDRDIPVINTDHPGQAMLDSEIKLKNGSPCFHEHLAMLNQNKPGEVAARFVDELAETIVGKIYPLADGSPQSLSVGNAWGRFLLYLEQLQDPSFYSLVTVRMIPINLKMFRSLQGIDLSERQLQVACGLAEGLSFKQLAARWRISRNSVITHASYLYDKLSLRNKEQLMNRYIWSASTVVG